MGKRKSAFFIKQEDLVPLLERIQHDPNDMSQEDYNLLNSAIRGHVVKMTSEQEIADEVSGLVLAEICRKIQAGAIHSAFDNPGAFVKYCKKLTESRTKDHIQMICRKKAKEAKIAEVNMWTANELQIRDRLIEEWISWLPPKQARAIKLQLIDELSVKEIAAVEGVPEGTIKSRLFNARKKIEEVLVRQNKFKK